MVVPPKVGLLINFEIYKIGWINLFDNLRKTIESSRLRFSFVVNLIKLVFYVLRNNLLEFKYWEVLVYFLNALNYSSSFWDPAEILSVS